MLGLLSGCGGGGGTTTTSGTTVIPVTTKVLDDNSLTKIATIAADQSSITFTETTSTIGNLRAGDVLVLGVSPATPEGLLKKVTAVQRSAEGITTVQTGPATLEDAVQKASVNHSRAFSASDVISDVTVAKGVRKALPLTAGSDSISLILDDVVVYDRDENLETKEDQITVKGTIGFKPTVEMTIDIESSVLKKFSFAVSGEQASDLTIKAGVPFPGLDKKLLLKSYNLGTQVFRIENVPVVVSYELGIYVGVKGNISLGLSANANQKLTYTGGVKYENNAWTPINTHATEFGSQLPTIDASAEAKCSAGTELSTKLYGVAGPYINSYGYLLLQSNLQNTPWWQLFAGFEGTTGANIEMFSDMTNARFNANIFEVRQSLAQAAATYSITGRVTCNGAALAGATVSAGDKQAVTDANGNYSINGLVSGSYTVTPAKSGYIIPPQAVTISNANKSQDFAATLAPPSTYTLSGTVSYNGAPLSGVLVSTTAGSSTTDSSGTYAISGHANGTYTVSPSKPGYIFSPQTVTIGDANNIKDFTATLAPTATYTLYGNVNCNGLPISGVLVSTSVGSSTTDSSGNYSISGHANGTYTVTPTKSGYSFTPQTVTIDFANKIHNFSGTLVQVSTYSISGVVMYNGNRLAGVTVTTSGGFATTSMDGLYTINGLLNGTYTVTPSKPGGIYTFTPQTVTINNGNMVQNFSATYVAVPTYSISGRVTLSGYGLSGVTIIGSGSSSIRTTTDASGNYSLTGALSGSYTIVPSLEGYAFSPASKLVVITNANATAQDFTATNTGSIHADW
jgi:inhibitor of cysteine peptidase